jgi:Na+-translocating ferredoxin:NAD+ oxidoreductase RnfG subunit
LAEIAGIDVGIIVALFALSSSVIVAFITYFSNRKLSEANRKSQAELEVLKKRLESKKSEEDARRDYNYEAIRRLYREFEPVLFQLVELSDSALR